jgi:chromatin segregation and condensation protein Rec8/ScpA/Scc1 (kleisin family)
MAQDKTIELAISLPRFDGPFDLLISLIRRNEWSIDDLPVREITSQFLAYIKAARDLDPELAGEFVETASWLVLLKSRSMLPVEQIEGQTPREELRRAVLDHATLTAKTEFLRGRFERNLHSGSAGAAVGRWDTVLPPSSEEAPTIQDALDAAFRAMEAARAASSFQITDDQDVNVEEQIRWISNKLASVPVNSAVLTGDWFEAQPTAGARAALLMALLELAHKGLILLYQSGDFAVIRVKALQQIHKDLQIESFEFAVAGIC